MCLTYNSNISRIILHYFISMSNLDVRFVSLNEDSWYHIFKLPSSIFNYFKDEIEISKQNNIDIRNTLAGNISSSLRIEDPKNLFIDKIFNPLFFSKYQEKFNHIVQIYTRRNIIYDSTPLSLEPVIGNMWVNFQKKYEFNPLHDHNGMFSFVIWVKIPYDLEEEKKTDIAKSSIYDGSIGNFSFVYKNETSIQLEFIPMLKKMEGYCVIFPAHLHHMVYPFYTSDEERISISGNIFFKQVKV